MSWSSEPQTVWQRLHRREAQEVQLDISVWTDYKGHVKSACK